MNLRGPIIIIEDDAEEAMLLQEVIREVAPDNEAIVIGDPRTAMDYLKNCDKPFLIFSGINLKIINGFQLRENILANRELSRKCTPYIFYAAHSSDEMLKKVYDVQAHGYFHDITDYNALGQRINSIITYWQESIA